MPNTPLSKIPYPSGSDTPAAAADMMALVMAMDARLVLPAVDEADRDARYYDAPASSLVVSGPSQKIWLKTGDGPTDWMTVHSDTGWVAEGFVVMDGWSIDQAKARDRNGIIDVRGTITRTGDKLTSNSVGELTDIDILSVPPQFRPEPGGLDVVGIARSQRTSGTIQLYSSGVIKLLDLHAGSSVDTDQFVRFATSFLGA